MERAGGAALAAMVWMAGAAGAQGLGFEPNRGQVDDEVLFLERGPGHTLFLLRDAAVFRVPGADVRMSFPGASARVEVAGEGLTEAHSHYLLGRRSADWVRDVPRFAGVRYAGLLDGIDARFHGDPERLELDFELAPGADPGRIRIAFEGHDGLALDAEGNLQVRLAEGALPFSRPVAFQPDGEEARPVRAAYVLFEDATVGFELGEHDPELPLVIDPVLLYSSFLGGGDIDAARGVVMANGETYVTGWTASLDFPAPDGLATDLAGPFDAFVVRLDSDGRGLAYATYLGGGGADFGSDLAVDAAGNVHVAGSTSSPDFPLEAPVQSELGGGFRDAFVTKLSADGRRLLYSTYLGGEGFDIAFGIELDELGLAHVCGNTLSDDFPTAQAVQADYGGSPSFVNGDAFLTGLAADGSLVFSTYWGGAGGDAARDVALDPQGRILLVGLTDSDDFPTEDAFQPQRGGEVDAFVATFTAKAKAVTYSTYLGGELRDFASGAAFDGLGNACVTGDTSSVDFPLELPLQSELNGFCDAFVTILKEPGVPGFSTYLGGSDLDVGMNLVVDERSGLVVVGETFSADFPTRFAAQPAFGGGGGDGFVTRLTAGGGRIGYSSYVGGSGFEFAAGVDVDAFGTATVVGEATESRNFPILRPFQHHFGGGPNDAFVLRTCVLPGRCPGRPLRSAPPPQGPAPDTTFASEALLRLLREGRSPLDPPRNL